MNKFARIIAFYVSTLILWAIWFVLFFLTLFVAAINFVLTLMLTTTSMLLEFLTEIDIQPPS